MGTRESVPFSHAWTHIDQSIEPAKFIQLMDAIRGPDADRPASYRPLIFALQLKDGQQILDVGCGLGGTARAVAQRVGSTGLVVGMDNSETMLAEARRRSIGRTEVRFDAGDAHHLPYETGTFNACYSMGTLELVRDPVQVASEMVRVVKPGGRIVAGGPDTEGMSIAGADPKLSRKIIQFIAEHEYNGGVGRALMGMLKDQGLIDVVIHPALLLFGFPLLRQVWLEPHLRNAQAQCVVSASEAERWLAELADADRRGRFLCAWPYYLVEGRKS